MTVLGCSRQELFRWIKEEKLPYDGAVHTIRFSSMSWSYKTVEGGWKPETIEKMKPFVEEWRAEHKEKMKAKKRKLKQRQKDAD